MNRSTQSGHVEVLEIIKEKDAYGLVVELGLFDIGLQVPRHVCELSASKAAVEVGVDPS